MQSVGPHTPSSVDFSSIDKAENTKADSIDPFPEVVFVGELVIAEEGSMEDFFPIDNPSSQHEDDMSIDDEFEEINDNGTESDNVSTGTKFLPVNHELNNQLKQNATYIRFNPKQTFELVAGNTNPKKIIFMLESILHFISELLTGDRSVAVLNRNCVHCAQAVDKTLASLCEENGTPTLHQVMNAGRGEFVAIPAEKNEKNEEKDKERLEVPSGNGILLGMLKQKIPEGKRACISVPVSGQKYEHAMNYVNISQAKQFIICGQTGTVYDLSLDTDCAKFAAQYGVQDSGTHYLHIAITGNAPGADSFSVENHEADTNITPDQFV